MHSQNHSALTWSPRQDSADSTYKKYVDKMFW